MQLVARHLVISLYFVLSSKEFNLRELEQLLNLYPVKFLDVVMLHYVYVLYSVRDSKKYVGYTKDIKKRLEAHQRGLVESTKDRRPLKLIYFEACLSQADAAHREKYLKTYHGKMFIKQRLKSYLTG